MIGQTTAKPSHERSVILAEILHSMPGNDSETQRNRMLTEMQRLGSVTSYEGSRFLDCYDPRARIHELRFAGHRVTTIMREVPTESGVLHYLGVYVLEGPATYPLFDGLDDEQEPA